MAKIPYGVKFVAALAAFIATVAVFAHFLTVSAQNGEAERARECVSQGGEVVTLGEREWCLINGQKIEF